MTNASDRWHELDPLLDRVLDGLYTDADLQRLNEILRTDDEACRHYISYVNLDGRLLWGDGREEVAGGPWSVASGERVENANPKSEILNQKSSNPQPPIPNPSPNPAPIIIIDTSSPIASLPSPFYVSHPYLFANLFSLLFMGVAALGAWMYKIDIPRPIAENDQPAMSSSRSSEAEKIEYVGKITGMVDVKWEAKGLGIRDWGLEAENHQSEIINHKSANPPSPVALGDKFALASGLMEITYKSGAKVILQGPCTYEAESNGGYLSVGKLTGKLEKKAEGGRPGTAAQRWSANESNPQSLIPNPLFVVRTPTATVTDLGTEFAVETPEHGDTVVCVFEGKVDCQPMLHDKPNGGPSRLVAGQTVRIIPEKSAVCRTSSSLATNFVRRMPLSRMPNSISLADFVIGGNGFGNRYDWGIDPRDASSVPKLFDAAIQSSGRYERYSGYPQIDGVFIPQGGDKPVQLDSEGHTFRFPATTGDSYGPIWLSRVNAAGKSLQTEKSTELCRALLLHANVGITFNLSAIRALTPRLQLVRLQATVVNQPPMRFDPKLGADVWVLVDGHVRFHRSKLRNPDGPVEVAVPLQQDDHFLSLVSTDGGDGSYFDYVQYRDPRIILEPTPD